MRASRIQLMILLAVIAGTWASCAFAEDSSGMIRQYMDQVRNGSIRTVRTDAILRGDPDIILAELQPFQADSNEVVRDQAYTIGWQLAVASSDQAVRQEVVCRLAQASADKSPLVSRRAAENLLDFGSDEFPAKAKEALASLLATEEPRGNVILVCGMADMRAHIPALRKLLIDEAGYHVGEHSRLWYQTRGWAARLALARMGSATDVERCIALVQSEPIPNVRVVRLLKHLAYIRHPAVIPILKHYLESDERVRSIRKGRLGVTCSAYALSALTSVLEDLPVKYTIAECYSEEQIRVAREWMRAQTSFRFAKPKPMQSRLW